MNEKNEHKINTDELIRYLASELSETERLKVEDWINQSEENKNSFDAFKRIWKSADIVKDLPDIDLEEEWQVQQKLAGLNNITKEEKGKAVIQLRQVLKLAASIIVLVGISILSYKYLVFSEKTVMAETKTILLPDSSTVTLNGNSKLSWYRNFGKEVRKLKLSGEAYFEVRSDTSRPFIVKTGETNVQVLGTSFNVNARKKNDYVKVTVTEGRVKVSSDKQKQVSMTIKESEELTYIKENQSLQKELITNNNYIAWKTLIIEFENEKLSDVIPVLESVYGKDIILKTPGTGSCTITARFDNKSLGAVLAILESTLELRISQMGKQIIIQGRNCN